MQDGWTPLTQTSYNGLLKAVKVLLAHKGDVNAKTNVSRREGCESAPMGLGGHDCVSRFGLWGQGQGGGCDKKALCVGVRRASGRAS